MKIILSLSLILIVACSSSGRKPSSVPATQPRADLPSNALTLEQALAQGADLTLQQLKAKITVASYPSMNSLEPMTDVPASVQNEKVFSEGSKGRSLLLGHLRRFRPWALARKAARAQNLLDGFQCTEMYESQALALSLERDYPDEKAKSLSESLHLKVITCDDVAVKQESLLRLSVFAIQGGQCVKALDYIKQFPPTGERGINDRLAYLQSFCSPLATTESRNPWGGYGVRLGDVKFADSSTPVWFLSTTSGSEDWDRVLASMIELYQKNQITKLQHVANHLNYEKFRSLPYPFQASMLVVLHFAEADLSVFQTLHRFLADHPHLTTKEVVGLLFPVRYWKEIVENSTGADPVLVKSLIRQESAFNPMAKSRARAYGLMQLIYPTARLYGIRKATQLLDPKSNIRVGSEFLGQLINNFGSVELALAAYNAGPLVVKDWQKRYPTENIDLFVEMIPYSETREYVRLVGRNYRIYQALISEHYLEKPSIAQVPELMP
jgi:hypothetical protein